jgi:hypothetical protein
MTQHEEGRYTISTRLFLTAAQRDRLQWLVLDEGMDLPELISELLGAYLDELPEPVTAPEPSIDVTAELAQRRAELRRVRARQRDAGLDAPTWLAGYIAELEGDIARLERLDSQS